MTRSSPSAFNPLSLSLLCFCLLRRRLRRRPSFFRESGLSFFILFASSSTHPLSLSLSFSLSLTLEKQMFLIFLTSRRCLQSSIFLSLKFLCYSLPLKFLLLPFLRIRSSFYRNVLSRLSVFVPSPFSLSLSLFRESDPPSSPSFPNAAVFDFLFPLFLSNFVPFVFPLSLFLPLSYSLHLLFFFSLSFSFSLLVFEIWKISFSSFPNAAVFGFFSLFFSLSLSLSFSRIKPFLLFYRFHPLMQSLAFSFSLSLFCALFLPHPLLSLCLSSFASHSLISFLSRTLERNRFCFSEQPRRGSNARKGRGRGRGRKEGNPLAVRLRRRDIYSSSRNYSRVVATSRRNNREKTRRKLLYARKIIVEPLLHYYTILEFKRKRLVNLQQFSKVQKIRSFISKRFYTSVDLTLKDFLEIIRLEDHSEI